MLMSVFRCIPSNNNADLAFVLHVLESLKVGGKAVVIIPHGVLFRGGAGLNIRKYLIWYFIPLC